jgi:HD-GYP domain-containing protein (c-di-GMP phosphodiesterase class II)
MAGAVSAQTISALNEDSEFIPINILSLRLDTITNFDLYIQVRLDEPAVLYAERHIPFTEDSRKRLKDNQVDCLYINASQHDDYRRYLEGNLQDILTDSTIEIDDKSEILHMSAHGIVKDIMQKGMIDEGLERGNELIQCTVDFVFGQRSALRHLIQKASRDYFSYTHAVNVAVMGIALAQRMGYESNRLQEFGMGAIMRDIGMSQIDPSISENPGRLTVNEFEIIKQHPVMSEGMLSKATTVTSTAMAIIRHHHEKLDGSGYPDGLGGDEIPRLVRLCTMLDIFDALSTQRPYKRAMSTFEALKLMNKELRGEIDHELFQSFVVMLGKPD